LLRDSLDATELPAILAQETRGSSAISALAALSRLEHLFDVPKDTTDCTICSSAATHLRERLINNTLQGQNRYSTEDIIQEVTKFLVARTDCLMFWNWAEELDWKIDDHLARDPNANAHLELLHNAIVLSSSSPGNHKPLWKKVLNDRKASAAPSLVSFWFDPLIEIIDQQQTERNAAGAVHSPTPTRHVQIQPHAHIIRNVHTPTPIRLPHAHNRVHALVHEDSSTPSPFFPDKPMNSSPCPSPELAIRSPASPGLPTSNTSHSASASASAQPASSSSHTPFSPQGSGLNGTRSDNRAGTGDRQGDLDLPFTFGTVSRASGLGATISRPDSRNRSFSEGDIPTQKQRDRL
jgi:hypothetical protein